MTDQTPARPLPPVTCPREGAVSPVPWPALPSTPRAGSGALTLQLHPPSPALFSFEAGGKGGAAAGAGSGGFSATSECPFLLESAANSGLAHRPPEGTSCVLGHPPCSTLYPWGREGRNTTGKRDDDVRPTHDRQVPREG